MVMGGTLPCITAAIRVRAPGSIQGEVLGYNVSFRFLGNVLGPLLGGAVSSGFSISAAFYVTAFLFLIGAGLLWMAGHLQRIQRQMRADRQRSRFLLNLTFSYS